MLVAALGTLHQISLAGSICCDLNHTDCDPGEVGISDAEIVNFTKVVAVRGMH